MANPVEIISPAGNKLAVNSDGSINAQLAADSDIIGKVGIDQTTPGTTNGVVVNLKSLTAISGSQFALTIGTNTTLTVPATSVVAHISVEGGDLRYTDDGTSASSTVGHPVGNGTAFDYSGPLAALKFTIKSGTPTINVSYYK